MLVLLPGLVSPVDAAGNEPLAPVGPTGGASKPFIFMWGRTYERFMSELPPGQVTASQPGQWILMKEGDLICRYSFYQKQRIKSVQAVTSPGPLARKWLSPPTPAVEYEPAEPAEQARLFAVSLHYAPLELEGRYRTEVEDTLTATYGKIINRTATYYDLENRITFVRAYLESYRRKTYLNRLVFSSKEVSHEMNEQRRNLEADATVRLKTEIERGGSAPLGPRPGPTPVSAPGDSGENFDGPSSIEETGSGYMEPAEETQPANMLEEQLPPEPGVRTEGAPEVEPVATPGGLQSEALPADYAGENSIENPFELP